MTDRVHLELFHCVLYNTRLTRSACAKRYVAERDGNVPPPFNFGQCDLCPVGAEHARALAPSEDGSGRRRRKRRGGGKRQADIAQAQARKAAAATASAPETPSTGTADRDVAPQNITQAAEDAPSRRWCAPADEALAENEAPAESAPLEGAPAKRRRGAPRPAASDEAEAWLAALSREQREHVVELVLDVVSTTDAGRVYTRAVLAHRVLELPLAATIEHLGSPEGLTVAACATAVHRGRWIVSRALRQRTLLASPVVIAELEAITPHLLALMAASRSDAGKPRPDAQGRRAPRKAPPETRMLSLLDRLDDLDGAA